MNEDVLSYLRSLTLFEALGEEKLYNIVADLSFMRLTEGEVLFRQGDKSDALFIVVNGQLEVSVHQQGVDVLVGKIYAGEMIGEIQVITGGPRTASVSALSDVELIRIEKKQLQYLLETCPELLPGIHQVIRRRLQRNRLLTILFEKYGIDAETSLADIVPHVHWRNLQQGDMLFLQGDSGDSMCIIISGLLKVVSVDTNGHERILNELGAGDTVGEMTLLTGECRSANVYAIRESDVVELSQSAFERIAQKHPQFQRIITKRIVSNLRKTIQTTTEQAFAHSSHRRNIALMPASPDVPLGDFALQLNKALSIHYSILHLNSERVNSLMGMLDIAQTSRDNPYDLMLSTWLSEQEATNQILVFEADYSVTPWTRRCLEYADQILIVGWATDDPTPGEIESELLLKLDAREQLNQSLVLLHDREIPLPAGTGKWLALRRVDTHHHLRSNEKKDMARLARLLSRRAVGLVLGGGGARGFAHIGIIRALEEANIPIDMICGVSMGAIIAAQYAKGIDVSTMLKINTRDLAERRLHRDFTLPIIAISSGNRFKRSIQRFFGATLIEDLWLNYFCVSCDLSTSETVVHRTGPLARAVQASNVAPGLLPPVTVDGHLLVDGGIVNNEPGDIMKDFCGGPVIVANVSSGRDITVDTSYEEMPTAWQILRSRLNPFQKTIQAPNIPVMILRTILVGSDRKSREVEKGSDYYLRPPIDQFSMTDYTRIEEISEIGYEYAKQRIEKWGRLCQS